MLHRTVWDAPSASSKKKLVSKLGTGVGYVTSNCMGRAVRQFEKKVGFKLGIGVGNGHTYMDPYGTRRTAVR